MLQNCEKLPQKDIGYVVLGNRGDITIKLNKSQLLKYYTVYEVIKTMLWPDLKLQIRTTHFEDKRVDLLI
jgi:hypothetical protein